ncbi:MAG: type II secretion system F family protein [Phycisphaeraceae bacterium]|nr:type II secretion system F family protein [Phycisphaerales bacterium]MCB9861225.1 type II secretion system F family protein [Phycisphaeraceae bacterium]
MPNYRYQVRSSDGQIQTGVMSADSTATVAQILRNQGGHVLQVSVANSAELGGGFLEKFREVNAGKPKTKHVLDFTTQLAVMMRAGINLRSALDGIAEQIEHPAFRKVVIGLKNDVESGKPFSEALQRHPKLFGPLYINMVRASEMAGSFADMLDRIAGYIAQEQETRKMVIGASIYPGVIATMAVGVTIFLLTFVLPKFEAVFEGKEDVLPWSTKFLLSASDFMIHNWYYVVGGLLGVVIGFVFIFKSEPGGAWKDRFVLRAPVLKGMFKALYISRSLQIMGQLINAGVPMLDTLAITGDISGNRVFKAMWRTVYASVKQGRKISVPLTTAKHLPKSVVQMITAGEESGKLGEVLDEVSSYYIKTLKEQIKTVTSLIEPIMIVIMGSVVGFIAMSIILPIFKMSQIVNH